MSSAVVFAYHNVGVSSRHGERSFGADAMSMTPMRCLREMCGE
ncbi:MAG: hypothetical protein NTY60_11595 [Proteobacteria bacterium]|nr:hypothetical protein [Pseudomonadota bacterium]